METTPTNPDLRDYFASAALQGLLAMHADPQLNQPHDVEMVEMLAEWAYDFADAMMKARKLKERKDGE